MTEKQALAEMQQWIESPMEYGESPKSISILEQRKIAWGPDEIVDAFLVKFTMTDGRTHIGFTGPVTWSFFDIDYNSLTHEELFEMYVGWFICFMSYHNHDPEGIELGIDEDAMKTIFSNKGYESLEVKQKVVIVDENYYEIKAVKDQNQFTIVGSVNNNVVYDSTEILPLYSFVGQIWDPLNLE